MEDALGILTGSMLVSLSLHFFQAAGVFIGGTMGLAMILNEVFALPYGAVYFSLNLPIYIVALRYMGTEFTLKTFAVITLVSIMTTWLPTLCPLNTISPWFGAVAGGLLCGTGTVILIRHQTSLGGVGTIAFALQKLRGWNAGFIQLLLDGLVLFAALVTKDLNIIAVSILTTVVINLSIAINHRPGRYLIS